ncbi:MAG: sulfurtransferase [Planctomycetaceae bacterium]|nr:sulfurtransferase [Planctomycetaceae bacterium]
MSNVPTISPQELSERLGSDPSAVLIDVRTPAEFREVHATAARNIPLDRITPQDIDSGKTTYVICRSGSRAEKACEKLLGGGCGNVTNVEGGTQAWEAAGLPVVRGKKTISLERQVRIAAGSLVLIGALLSWFYMPAFVWLSAFVGAGLVFAGVTDTCGMGMMLAKMPWNQAGGESCCGTQKCAT